MSASVFKFQTFSFVNGEEIQSSKDMEPIFKKINVSSDGSDNGFQISQNGTTFDFNAKKLGNIAAGTATGHAIEYDQLQTALGLYVPLTQKGAANGVATLDGAGKIPSSQLTIDAMEFKGMYDADQNSPALVDGTGNKGDVYIVSVAGTQDFGSGDIDLVVGNFVIYDGSVWATVPSAMSVTSVNGQTGVVVLDTDDINEGSTNLYYTNARFDTRFGTKTTTDLAKGTHLYYTAARFNTAFSGKSTSDLAEGSNLYFTTARARTAAVVNTLGGSETDQAPSVSAVNAALALKADKSEDYKSYTNDQGGAITIRQVVYESDAGEVKLLRADAAVSRGTSIALVRDASIADQASGTFWKPHRGTAISGFTGLTLGTPVYVSRTSAGSYTQDLSGFVSGEKIIEIGIPLSATELAFTGEYRYAIV